MAERLNDRSLDEVTRRGVETILGESERAAKIVRNLLTFAHKRQTTRTMVDLNQVVRDTLALRAYEQGLRNIATIEALAEGLPEVFADSHQVKQVLLNLIINAEQAMLAAHGRGTLIAGRGMTPTGNRSSLRSTTMDPAFRKRSRKRSSTRSSRPSRSARGPVWV